MLAWFIAFAVVITSLIGAPARAGVLWYNGSYDGRDSLTDQSMVPVQTGNNTYTLTTQLVYEDFVVPAGQTWTITSVFVNDAINYNGAISTATWQIRSGVGAGNGGTLVASGDTSATATALSGVTLPPGYSAETITATVSSVVLTAGTYWVAVAPDSLGYYSDQAYALTTSGANAVGTPAGNDGNSYVTNNYPTSGPDAFNFTPTTTALAGDGDGSLIDFSMGVSGTSVSVTPEPSSLVLAAIGLGAIALAAGRRARRAD